MKDSSYADRRIIDRLNAELSAIPVPARPSVHAPQRASGTLPALFAVAAIVAAIAFVALRFVPAVSDRASSQVSPAACPATTTRDASGVITSSGDLGLIEIRTATFPGEKLIVLVRRGAVPGDALELRAEAVLPPGGKVMWSTAATPRTTAWGSAVFDVNTKPIGNGGCWRLVRNDGPADEGIVVDLDRSSPNPSSVPTAGGGPDGAIRAVQQSRPVASFFATFPKTAGLEACDIRGGGPPPGLLITGTCRTDVQASGSSYVVTFTITWDARQFHLAGEPSSGQLQHSWPFVIDAAGVVTPNQDSGNFPPQYAK